MLKRMFLLGVLALAAPAVPAGAATYTIDPAHSNIGFAIRHLMVSNVRGSFREFSGTFTYDPANPQGWQAEATIQAGSVDTGVAKRDEHLRGTDFFDVAQFPTLSFKSTGVEPGPDGTFKLRGDLTMHGVTRPVVLDATLLGTVKDPRGNVKTGFTATGKLKRSDFFGKVYGDLPLEGGGVMLGNEVTVTLEIEAQQNP